MAGRNMKDVEALARAALWVVNMAECSTTLIDGKKCQLGKGHAGSCSFNRGTPLWPIQCRKPFFIGGGSLCGFCILLAGHEGPCGNNPTAMRTQPTPGVVDRVVHHADGTVTYADDTYVGFEKELRELVNRRSLENASSTPDYILARFLSRCLEAWDECSREREKWARGVNAEYEAGAPRKQK